MQADYNADVLAYGSQCIAYWPLTEASGTSFADSKGSNTATVATSPTRITGPDGSANAIDIAATANKVAIPGSQVAWPESYTVCFWARMNSVPASDAMAFEWNQSAFAKYVQFDAGYTGAITTFTTGARSFMSTYYGTAAGAQGAHHADTDFGTATWKFVAVTFDASQGATAGAQKVYIDGTLVSVTTSLTLYDQPDGAPGSGYLGIGGRNNAGTRQLPLDGALNGFAVLATVLNSTQINTLRLSMLATAKSASDTIGVSDSADPVVQTVPVSTSDTAAVADSALASVNIPGGLSQTVTVPFTGTNDTALHTYDARIVAHPASADYAHIYSNQAEGDGQGATAIYYWNEAPASADYDVQADVHFVAATASPYTLSGVTGRMDSSATTWYQLHLDEADGYLYLYKFVAGVVTLLGSYNAGISAGNTYTLRLEMHGASIVGKLDGTSRISVTDYSITAAGYPGFRVGPQRATAGTHNKGLRLDNFAVYTGNVSLADTATVTEGSPSVTDPSTAATSASDTLTVADTASPVLAKIDPASGAVTAAVSGSIATVAAATGASDSLNHNAFCGACLLPNGNHLVGWEHAYQHAGTPSKILIAQTNPATGAIVSGPTTLYTCQSGWNAADVSCWVDGTDVYVMWNESSTPRLANINTVTNTLLALSTDGGSTFGTPTAIDIGFASNGAGVAGKYGIAANPALVKPDGDWLLPVYGFDDKVALTNEYVKLRRRAAASGTWSTVATFNPPFGVTGFDETAIIQFDNGHRALIFRTFITSGATCFYISRNDGTDDTTWTTPTLLLSNAGGRPALIQTSTGAVLMMYRYMVGGTVSGHTHLVYSTDRLLTFSSPVDPYDGAAGRTSSSGYTSPPPMGLSVYGAFAPSAANSPNAVLYYSEEDSSTDTRAVLMARPIVTIGGAGERFTVSDSVSVTVGVGATAKSASDSAAVTDTSSGLTVVLTTATDTVTVTDTASNASVDSVTASDVVSVSEVLTQVFEVEGSSITLHPQGMVPGTSISAYLRWEWLGPVAAKLNAGPGAAVKTTTVADDLTVTFGGLDAGEYVAYAADYPTRRLFFMVTE